LSKNQQNVPLARPTTAATVIRFRISKFAPQL
jgi:hypothetical protein